ncbi:MAG: hypothetical protein IPF99_34640 [Deltaproteobacteria bacterium]|nr:hypothetical protein [Deltaproteobacteria bacterium]
MSSQSGSGHRSERQHAVGRKHTNVIPAIATIDVTVIDCRSGLPVQHAIIEYLKFGKVTTIDRRSMPLPRKGGHALLPQTNADGVVSIPLDLVTLRDGGKLELGFRGFAIVAEATRAETEDSAAGKVFRPLSTDASVSGVGASSDRVRCRVARRRDAERSRVGLADHARRLNSDAGRSSDMA